jgi:hypothetical protein
VLRYIALYCGVWFKKTFFLSCPSHQMTRTQHSPSTKRARARRAHKHKTHTTRTNKMCTHLQHMTVTDHAYAVFFSPTMLPPHSATVNTAAITHTHSLSLSLSLSVCVCVCVCVPLSVSLYHTHHHHAPATRCTPTSGRVCKATR